MAALLFIIITNILTLNPLFIDTAAVMTSMIWCLYYTYKQKKTKEQYIQTQAIRLNAGKRRFDIDFTVCKLVESANMQAEMLIKPTECCGKPHINAMDRKDVITLGCIYIVWRPAETSPFA